MDGVFSSSFILLFRSWGLGKLRMGRYGRLEGIVSMACIAKERELVVCMSIVLHGASAGT
jgi:hypothetical protein